MRNILFRLAVLSFVLLSVIARTVQAQQVFTEKDLAEYIRDNYDKQEVMIPMRDGVRLFTSIYTPKSHKEKWPILLNRTPYSVAPYGKDEKGRDSYKALLGPDELFAREGYIFVYQDVRGRLMSEGTFEDVRPVIENKRPGQTDESTDAWDTIDWLVKNVPNNNGRVGVYGISYPGYYASTAAIDSHPALKAASPQAPVSDWFHGDDLHHNGAIFLTQNYWFANFFSQERPGPVSDYSYLKPWKGRDTQDSYDFFLRLGGLKEASDYFQTALGSRLQSWDEMLAHPNYDEYWRQRNVLLKLKNIHCAVMTVGGWYDDEDLYGALNTYRSIETQNPGIFNILVMGPWFHGGWVRSEGEWLGTAYFGGKQSLYYQREMELPFFNYFLKDKGSIAALREINVFDTGSHEWRTDGTWNGSPAITQQRLYLEPRGGLSFSAPSAAGFDEYVSDPMNPVPYTQKITKNYPRDFMTEDQRFASTRPDVLVYETEPLDQDITVAGDLKPDLWISSSGTDSDFVVKLIDVFPDDYQFPATDEKLPNGQPKRMRPPEDSAWSVFQPGGYQMLLRGEPFPARFRSSFERPSPLTRNTPAEISFVMPGVVHTFKRGHRIMVQIQSTWFPLVARNPQKFMPNYALGTQADFQKATERVYYGGTRRSALLLPILKTGGH